MEDGREAFYNEYVLRKQGALEEDRIRKILAAITGTPATVLDIGCGRGTLLRLLQERFNPMRLVGIDIAPETPAHLQALGFEGYAGDASAGLAFDDASFDLVVCGEVIEHVVDTDRLIAEVARVLRPGGMLILTTPNLAYAVNRVLLAVGLQPLFTETSLHRNLGRKWGFLGQGGSTQGHLKLFTAGALREIVEQGNLHVRSMRGYRFFQRGPAAPIDALFACKASLAAGFVLVAVKESA